jgi:hypothetical protein
MFAIHVQNLEIFYMVVQVLKIKKKYIIHLEDANKRRKVYKEFCTDPPKNSLVISYDYKMNLALPHLLWQPNIIFYKRKKKILCFNIFNENKTNSEVFLYDEVYGGKTCNEIITMIEKFLNNFKNKNLDLYIFSDNCCSQNKNNFLISYYYYLVLKKEFKSITIRYLKSGHSHFSPDRNFGHIEIQKKKEDIYNLEEAIEMVKRSDKNQTVTNIDKFKDYKNYFDGFFNKLSNITDAGEIFINGDDSIYFSENYNLEKKKYENEIIFLKNIKPIEFLEKLKNKILEDQPIKKLDENKKKDLEDIYLKLQLPEKYKKDYYFYIKETKENEKKEKKEKKKIEILQKKIEKKKQNENYSSEINKEFKKENLDELKLDDLKKYCKNEGLKRSGNKEELIKIILNYFSTNETGYKKRKRKNEKEKINKKRKIHNGEKTEKISKCEK